MRKIFLFIVLTLSAFPLWAQYSADPHEDIYDDLHIWEGRGYISYLPQFRPLPEVVLITALKEVVQKGDNFSARSARNYLKNLEKTTFRTDFSAFGRLNRTTLTTEDGVREDPETIGYANGSIIVTGNALINDYVSLSAGIGGHGLGYLVEEEGLGEIRKTHYSNQFMSRMEELEEIRITSIVSLDTDVKVSFSSRTSFTVGKENFYLNSGFMRRSIGVFHDDGIIVSPRAPQSANLLAYWGKKRIEATWLLMSLSSAQEYISFDYDEDTDTVASEGSTRNRLDKFFSYNSLTLRPTDKWEVSMFEAVTFGQFNIGYILPIKLIYSTDSLSDFAAGNLIAGFNVKYKPIRTFTIPFSMLVDDISVSQYIRFNFYSKLKAAAEIAGEWTPINPVIREIKLGYQIVTPYTYTHPPASTYETYSTAYNDANHAHNGQHLATTLDPSSHRIYLATDFLFFRMLKFGTILKLEQHNNPSAGILKGPLNDGSIVDDGYRSVYDDDNGSESATFQQRIDFLNSKIETTWEAGANVGMNIPMSRSLSFYTIANYTYKYINNYNLTDSTREELIFMMDFGISITQRRINKAEVVKYTDDSPPLKYE